MKLQTPLDTHIQNCLVLPWHPNFGNWPTYIGDYLNMTDDNLDFGRVSTSPNSNGDFIRDGVVLNDLVLRKGNPFDKQLWFPQEDGAYKFELEVPRYSKSEISVTIEDDGIKTLVIVGERGDSGFTEKYDIPNSSSLDLENSSAKVENGLLTVFFPKKLIAAKTIKVL